MNYTEIVEDQGFDAELGELAQWSEWWNAVFEWEKLTQKQRNVIQTIIWISWQFEWWDINWWEFTVRVIVETNSKFVTVIQNTEKLTEAEMY